MIRNKTDRTTVCERCSDEFKPRTELMQSLFGDIGVDEDEMERFCRRCRWEMIDESTFDKGANQT